MSSRNRSAGHAWELEIVNALKPFFPEVASSRSCNRVRDGEKCDLAYPDEAKLGRFPFNIQAKTTAGTLNYNSLLDEMPTEEIRVVLHRRTKKSVGGKFVAKSKVAVMPYEDFLILAAIVSNVRKQNAQK